MKNILFRADSSSVIGTGHVMRDLVLAEQYKDTKVIFAVQDLSGNINHKIIEKGHEIVVVKSNELQEVVSLVEALQVDQVVIDHYGIDATYEKGLKDATGVQILSLDDTYEEHYCDILLNHNISAEPSMYKGLLPDHCELRCGEEYTLLREEFYQEQEIRRDKIYDVFLGMGGADTANLNIEILKILPQNLNVSVVTTESNKNLKALEAYAKRKPNINLFVNSNDLAKIINQSKLAIVTPSVIVNEVCFMNIPFIAIKAAENQQELYHYLIRNAYLALEEFNEMRLLQAVEVLANG